MKRNITNIYKKKYYCDLEQQNKALCQINKLLENENRELKEKISELEAEYDIACNDNIHNIEDFNSKIIELTEMKNTCKKALQSAENAKARYKAEMDDLLKSIGMAK